MLNNLCNEEEKIKLKSEKASKTKTKNPFALTTGSELKRKDSFTHDRASKQKTSP